jgi:hypothetical protein
MPREVAPRKLVNVVMVHGGGVVAAVAIHVRAFVLRVGQNDDSCSDDLNVPDRPEHAVPGTLNCWATNDIYHVIGGW